MQLMLYYATIKLVTYCFHILFNYLIVPIGNIVILFFSLLQVIHRYCSGIIHPTAIVKPNHDCPETSVNSIKSLDVFKTHPDYIAIKSHNEILLNDRRSHFYLCGLIDLSVKKTESFNKLYVEITRAKTITDVKAEIERCRKLAYPTFNKGQNITTRFLGLFGYRTTSALLFDNLEETVENIIGAHGE